MKRLLPLIKAEMVRSIREGDSPRIPEGGLLVWRIFTALSRARTYNFGGPNPISFTDIEAFARLYRWPLQEHHIDMIRALDDAWITEAMASRGEGAGRPKRLKPSMSQITPELFDAMMG